MNNEGFPRITAKYPEIQKDVCKGYYGDTIRFRVATIFDQETYANQYETTLETIKYLDNTPDIINSHEIIFSQIETQLKEAIEKTKSAKVKHMVEQISNINLN